MPTFYSEQITKLNTVPAIVLPTEESHAKVRILRIDYAQVAEGAIATVIQLAKLPAGRVRLLGKLSQLYHNLTTATVDLDIGWAAYTDFDAAAVAADDNGLDADVDCETAGIINVGSILVAECQDKVFESQEGVIITGTIKAAVIAADDVLKGYLAYALD